MCCDRLPLKWFHMNTKARGRRSVATRYTSCGTDCLFDCNERRESAPTCTVNKEFKAEIKSFTQWCFLSVVARLHITNKSYNWDRIKINYIKSWPQNLKMYPCGFHVSIKKHIFIMYLKCIRELHLYRVHLKLHSSTVMCFSRYSQL